MMPLSLFSDQFKKSHKIKEEIVLIKERLQYDYRSTGTDLKKICNLFLELVSIVYVSGILALK